MIVACALAFMPLLNGQAFAAAKKPAKVKISSAKASGTTVTVKWKKAKNAKKYNVKIDKKVVKKNVKAKKATIKNVAAGKHKVYVQAVNGKKKGKWSKAKTVTVKSAAPTVVAVTGVTIDNTTPKVGDTLTAKVAPENATNVKYAWSADGVAIEGATAQTFVVTADQLNKKITVKVDGDNNSTATSAETAAVAPQTIGGIGASQTGEKQITVTFDNAVDDKVAISVVRGAVAQTIVSKEFSADMKSVVLTIGAKIGEANYTVSATPTGATEALTATFKGVAATLTEAKALNDNLVLTAVNGTTGTALVKGYNQFGEEVKLDAANLASPKATTAPTYDAKTGVVSFTTQATTPYIAGEKVTLTFTYANNTKVFSHEFTVVSQAYVNEITFGEVATDVTKLKNEPVYKKNLTGTNYYLPVVAKDQYGTALTADQLNAEFNANRIFITPTASALVVIANAATQASDEPFAEKEDESVYLTLGTDENLALFSGQSTISILSIGGSTFQTTVDVAAEADIDTIAIDVAELHAGHASDVTLTATDKDGNEIDLYDADFTDGSEVLMIEGISSSGVSTVTANDGVWTVKKNNTKKTVAITYTPAGDQTTASFTWLSATPKTGIVGPIKVNDAVAIAGIKGVNKNVKTVYTVGTAAQNLTFDFVNDLGEDDTTTAVVYAALNEDNEPNASADYVITAKKTTNNGAVGAPAVAEGKFTVTPADELDNTATDTIKVQLWATNDGGTYTELDSLNVKLTTVVTDDVTYGIKAKQTINVSAETSTAVVATAQYNGADVVSAVNISQLKTTTPGFEANVDGGMGTISVSNADLITSDSGEYNMTAVLSNGETVSATGAYKKEPAQAEAIVVKNGSTKITKDAVEIDTDATVGESGLAIYAEDQYGNVYENAVVSAKVYDTDKWVKSDAFSLTSGYVVASDLPVGEYQVTVTAGTVTRTIAISVVAAPTYRFAEVLASDAFVDAEVTADNYASKNDGTLYVAKDSDAIEEATTLAQMVKNEESWNYDEDSTYYYAKNPKVEGWFESEDATEATTDTEIDLTKTYYIRTVD